jgi:hypothetical protein
MTNGPARKYSDLVNQAIGMVAEQTRGTIAEAIAALEERAASSGQTLEHVAEAVVDRTIRFGDG